MPAPSALSAAASRLASLLSSSVLAWPAWLRVIAVLPVVALLWCLVMWASAEGVL